MTKRGAPALSHYDIINNMTYDQDFREELEDRIGKLMHVTLKPGMNQILLRGLKEKIILPLKETVMSLQEGAEPLEILE